jgi:7-cyano-7-deazaguanine synthase in queuosine biosynthesis
MAITLKEQKRRVLESLSQNEEMNPKDHVKRKANGTYCVYKPAGFDVGYKPCGACRECKVSRKSHLAKVIVANDENYALAA